MCTLCVHMVILQNTDRLIWPRGGCVFLFLPELSTVPDRTCLCIHYQKDKQGRWSFLREVCKVVL